MESLPSPVVKDRPEPRVKSPRVVVPIPPLETANGCNKLKLEIVVVAKVDMPPTYSCPEIVNAVEETVAKLGPREQLALFSKTILEPKSRYVLMLEELTLPFIEEALDKDKITL